MFIREPVVLNWTFGGGKSNERTLYEIAVADNQDFTHSMTQSSDGNSWYSYQEGEQWWRVRAKTGRDVQGAWSKPLKTTYYANSYSRIKKDDRVIVFVSNSVSQGIFRFLDREGRWGGVDIDLADQIAGALSVEMKKSNKISPFFVPVAWNKLLEQPGMGTSDMIISSISRRDSRENKYQIKFSEPYFCTGQSLLYRKTDPDANKTVGEMLRQGKVVGYQNDTTSEQLIDKLANDLKDSAQPTLRRKLFGETENIVQSLLAPNSSIQLAVTDTTFAVDRLLRADASALASKPFLERDFPSSATTEERRDDYAIAVAQGETKLLESINKAITDLRRNGALRATFEKAAAAKFPNIDSEKRAQLYHSTCAERETTR
jgi:ABC-type amino acid transport substrate-binding protein